MNLRINFLIALAGLLGSLYFSEVLKLPPCSLCWYQRIFLYPLVFIFGSALLTEQPYRVFSLPLTIVGLIISIYHNLLYFGLIAETLAPCTKELSCTAKQLELFGFVTIPVLSLIGFSSILIFTLLDRTSGRSQQ